MTYHSAFFALSDPSRRNLFEAIAGQSQSVVELATGRPISRPAVSQHLKVLIEAQLVTATPHGARNIYSLDQRGLSALRGYVDQFWSDALGAYGAEVRRQVTQQEG